VTVQSSPSDLVIRPRELRIDSSAPAPRWWLGGDPFGTAVMNALSLTFPDGERFFIQSVRRFEKDCPAELRAQVRAFVQQEGLHTREHIAFNAMAEEAGYDLVDINRYIDGRMAFARSRPELVQLASTVALEHFTAAFAHLLLKERELLDQAPPHLAKLWRWHAIEEIEHKGVAYDVFLHATRHLPEARRRKLRRWVMFLTTVRFTKTVRDVSLMLLRQDGVTGLRAWWGVQRWLWASPGLYRRVMGDYLAFYRPRFHPWQVDDRALIAGAEAELALA